MSSCPCSRNQRACSVANIVATTIDRNRATGESYPIAHHVFGEDGACKIMIASLRYLDTFAKIDGRWYFSARDLILDWSETPVLSVR